MDSSIISRDYYLNQLVIAKDKPMVKVITGLKRSGKSVLFFNLFYNYLLKNGIKKNHIITVDLETQKNKPFRDSQKLYEHITILLRKSRIKSATMFL